MRNETLEPVIAGTKRHLEQIEQEYPDEPDFVRFNRIQSQAAAMLKRSQELQKASRICTICGGLK